MKIESATLTPTIFTKDLVDQDKQFFENKIERASAIEDSTLGQKTQAFFNTWREAGSVDEIKSFITAPFQPDSYTKPDVDWQDMAQDNKFILEFAATYNAEDDPDFLQALRESPNVRFAQRLGNDRLTKETQGRLVDDVITDMTQTVASASGGFLDADMLVGGVLTIGSKLKFIANGIKAKTIIGAELGTYTFSTVARVSEDIHYNTNDAAVDLALGAAIGLPLMKFVGSSRVNVNKIAKTRGDSVTETDELLDVALDRELKQTDMTPTSTPETVDTTGGLGVRQTSTLDTFKTLKASKAQLLTKLAKATKIVKGEVTRLNKAIKNAKGDKELITKLKNEKNALKLKLETDGKAAKIDLAKIDNTVKSKANQLNLDKNLAKYGDEVRDFKAVHARSQKIIEDLRTKFDTLFNKELKPDDLNLKEFEDALNDSLSRGGKDTDKIKLELDKITGRLKESNDFKIKERKDGSFNITYKGKGMRGKIPAIVAMSLVGASTANASDGGDEYDVGSWLILGILGSFLAASALKGRADAGSYKAMFANAGAKISRKVHTAKIEAKERSYTENVEAIGEGLRVSWFESYTSIAKEGAEAKRLVDVLIQNLNDGTVDNVAAIAVNLERSYTNRLSIIQRDLYGKFAKAEKATFAERVVSAVYSTGVKYEFNKAAGQLLRGTKVTGKFTDEGNALIKEFADEQRLMYNELQELMGELGMPMGKLDNYMPRLINPEAYSLLQQADDATLIAIKTSFRDMIYKSQEKPNIKVATKQADKYIEGLMRTSLQRANSSDDILLDMVDQVKRSGKDIEGADKIVEDLLGRLGDKAKHTKTRAKFNIDDFGDTIKGNVGGKAVDINIDQLFDLDTHTVFDRYLRVTSGHIAFAQKGYKRIASFDKELNELAKTSPSAAKKLDDLKKIILGDSILDPAKGSVQAVTFVKNLAIGLALPLVGVSLIPEILKTTLRSGGNYAMFKQNMHEIVRVVSRDPNSELVEQLMSWTGQGNSRYNTNIGFKGFSDISNEESMMRGQLQSVSAGFRNAVLSTSQLLRTNDYMHRLNMVGNMETLAKYLDGSKKLTPLELQKFGITDKTKELLGGELKLTDLQNLKKVDDSKWSRAQKNEMIKVLNAMEQRYVQDSALGASALWTKDSSFGKLFGTLLSFPMTAYNNHGLMDAKGIATGDLNSMMNQVIWYSASYMSIKAKAEIQNKKFDEDEAMKQAFLMMPIFGVASVSMSAARGGILPSVSTNVVDLGNALGDFVDD